MSETARQPSETDKRFAAEVDVLELRRMRGWIGEAEYRAELVKIYDRFDLTEGAEKPDFWTAIRDDVRMARVRKVLSLNELRTIARHAWDNPVYRLWQDADTAPQTGFFLAWSPDFPDMVSCWKAEIFHEARKPGTPKHLSANHFTKWMPVPLPARAEGKAGA